MRRLVCLFVLSSVTFACKTPQTAQNTELKITNGQEITEADYPAVVMLMSDNDAICTGTFINDYQVLTAAHCVRNKASISVVTQRFLSTIRGLKTLATSTTMFAHPGYNKAADNALDLGIINFPRGTSAQALKLSSRRAEIGDHFLTIGFGNDTIDSSMPFGQMYQSGVTHKRIGSNRIERVEAGTLQFRGHISPGRAEGEGDERGERVGFAGGDSGSPMLDRNGDIIGITSGGKPKVDDYDTIREFTNIAVDLSSNEAVTFMRQHLGKGR